MHIKYSSNQIKVFIASYQAVIFEIMSDFFVILLLADKMLVTAGIFTNSDSYPKLLF